MYASKRFSQYGGRWLRRNAAYALTSLASAGAVSAGRRNRSPSQFPSHPLRVERLEDRCLMDATLLDPNLGVRPVISGLVTPSTMAFLGDNDFFVLEKNTGRVQHVVNGVIDSTVLSLPVNNASERGLLGIALDPDFENDHNVYLYWTESSTGQVSSNLADVPLRGNRVDRFIWNHSTLAFDKNLIQLRSFQADEGQPLRGNHNAGVLKFGPDGKLYIVIGDNGRRGWMQNITQGFGPDGMDDQFGGPEPDNAHLTGVVLRLNRDGSTPTDNPFFDAGAQIGGEVGANIQKVFAYGVRNTFGMAFDSVTGKLWLDENGDDSFDKISRVEPGSNNGWIQSMGPLERVLEYKGIETAPRFFGLQQIRWPPTLIADTPEEALARMFMLPGAHYNPPEWSWRYAVPPAGLGFLTSSALGAEYEGDMFIGSATANPDPALSPANGYLMRFKLNKDRTEFVLDNPRVKGKVAENFDKFDLHGSENQLIGTDFGIGTDIQTGPNGNLFVVSLSQGTVYEIFRQTAAPTPGKNVAIVAALPGLFAASPGPVTFVDTPAVVTPARALPPLELARVDQLFAALRAEDQRLTLPESRHGSIALGDGWLDVARATEVLTDGLMAALL